jgi:hypothetical protein
MAGRVHREDSGKRTERRSPTLKSGDIVRCLWLICCGGSWRYRTSIVITGHSDTLARIRYGDADSRVASGANPGF